MAVVADETLVLPPQCSPQAVQEPQQQGVSPEQNLSDDDFTLPLPPVHASHRNLDDALPATQSFPPLLPYCSQAC
jgi:hypothetical protein